MTRTRSITFLAGATALVVAALAAAGCGGSGGSNANSPAPPKNANGQSATASDRQADGRQWSERFDRRDERPLGRQATGHLQRAPALSVLGRPEGRRHERTGRERLRRPLVRAVVIGRRNHHTGGQRWRL